MIRHDHPGLSLSRQCGLLSISQSPFYYAPKGENAENMELMRRIDELFLKKRVNEEIAALGDDGTFADLKLIDKKLGLPRGTSFEMGGYSDYFAFEETGED